MSLDAKDMKCFAWEFKSDVSANAAVNRGTFFVGLFKRASASTAVVVGDVDVTTTVKNGPVTDTTAFGKTATWTLLYHSKVAEGAHSNTGGGSYTWAEQQVNSANVTYNASTVSLKAKPSVATAAWNSTGWDMTWTFSYEPAADADNFYVNGKLYSAALYTLSQSAALAFVGFKGCDKSACTTAYEYK